MNLTSEQKDQLSKQLKELAQEEQTYQQHRESKENHLKANKKNLQKESTKGHARRSNISDSSSDDTDNEKHRITQDKNIRKEKDPYDSKVQQAQAASSLSRSSLLSDSSATPRANLAAAISLHDKAVSNDQEKIPKLVLRSQQSEPSSSCFENLRKKLCCQRANKVSDRRNSEDETIASLYSARYNKPRGSTSGIHHGVGHYRKVDRFTSELLQLKVQADEKKGRRGRRRSTDTFRGVRDPEAEAVERRLHLRWLTYHFDKNPNQFSEGPVRESVLNFKASQESATVFQPSNSNASLSSSGSASGSIESSVFSQTSESKESTTNIRPSKSQESSETLLPSKSNESLPMAPNAVEVKRTPPAPLPKIISVKNANKRSNSAAKITENWLGANSGTNLKPRLIKSYTETTSS